MTDTEKEIKRLKARIQELEYTLEDIFHVSQSDWLDWKINTQSHWSHRSSKREYVLFLIAHALNYQVKGLTSQGTPEEEDEDWGRWDDQVYYIS